MLTSTSLPPTAYKCVNAFMWSWISLLHPTVVLFMLKQKLLYTSTRNLREEDHQNHGPKQYTNPSLSRSLQKNCTKVPEKVITKHWVYGKDTARLEKFIYSNSKISGIFLSQLKKNREEKLQENDLRNGFSFLTSIKHRCVTWVIKSTTQNNICLKQWG